MSWSLSNIEPLSFIAVFICAAIVYLVARLVTRVLIKKGVFKDKIDIKSVLEEDNDGEGKNENRTN